MAGVASAAEVRQPEKLHHGSVCFGLLDQVQLEEDYIVASIGRREIALPVSVEMDLRPLIGQRIGIVKVDQMYRVRRA